MRAGAQPLGASLVRTIFAQERPDDAWARSGSYFPAFLQTRRRGERALCAMVAQCYVEGVSSLGTASSTVPSDLRRRGAGLPRSGLGTVFCSDFRTR